MTMSSCNTTLDTTAERAPAANVESAPAVTIAPLPIRDFLTGGELERADLQRLLLTAVSLKRRPLAFRTSLVGQALAMLFEKPSFRTRLTFEVGFAKLGGHAAFVDPTSAKIGQRESLEDAARNLERWVEVIVARTFEHETVLKLADIVEVPVINALSDRFHPCQALADVLTLAEHCPERGWSEIALAWVGDGNNVCHSLLLTAATLGMTLTVITPEGHAPQPEVVAEAQRIAQKSGASITFSHTIDAVAGHDVIYTDTWVSMGDEAEQGARQEAFEPYRVTPEVMVMAGAEARFMHCLPVDRGREVEAEVIDGPQSIVFDQAENRMHAQNALLLHLLAPGIQLNPPTSNGADASSDEASTSASTSASPLNPPWAGP